MRTCVVGFAFGVWLLQQQAQLPAAVAFVPVPLLIFALLAGRRFELRWRENLRRIVLPLCCIACGFGWAAWLAHCRLADELPAAWEGADIQLVGVVASMPQAYERSARFEFDVERVLTQDAVVPSHIVLSWWGAPAVSASDAILPGMHAGERWQLTVRMRRPHGTLNPAGFDYEAWLLERNIRATGYVRASTGNRRLAAFVMTPAFAVERLREAVRARIIGVLADAPYAGVLIALAVGDQRAIAAEQWQVFTRTGVNHLMSISGLHVTMLAGLAFALVYHGWRRSARLTLRLPARKAAVLAGLLSFWYVVLPHNPLSDVGLLAIAAVVVLTKVFSQVYPRPHDRLAMEALGQAMWIRTGLFAILSVRRVKGIGFGFWPEAREWGIGAAYFAAFLPLAAGLGWIIDFTQPRMPGPGWEKLLPLTFFGTLWVLALGEELFFRGLLQQWMSQWLGSEWNGLFATAAIFGSVHLFYNQFPNWRFALLAAVAGVFYGMAFRTGKGIRAAMVTHALTVTTWKTFFS